MSPEQQAARDAALEEAARIAEKDRCASICDHVPPRIAAAIRALRTTPPPAAQGEITQEQARRMRDALAVASNTCGDVTRLGRFSRAVDPVRWVADLKAHLDAALAGVPRA